MADRAWSDEYAKTGRIWGDEPTPLAVYAARRLAGAAEGLRVLDVGCGYGRDALFLARTLGCDVLGVDAAEAAIVQACESARDLERGRARFVLGDMADITEKGFDVVFAANLYQILRAADRPRFQRLVADRLAPGGTLLMSTLSVHDPQEYGRGKPVPGERNSFESKKFLHFSSLEELEHDFGFLALEELREIEYDEPRAEGEPHHHVSWLLVGRLA